MVENGNLSRLASKLSPEERLELLEKLREQSNISQAPLYGAGEENGAVDIAAQYARLPWYLQVSYSVLGFFKSRPSFKIFEDHRIAALGRKISYQAPGFYDYRKGVLLPSFYNQLQLLKNSARFFYTALDAGVNRDKGAFYAFLGSLEMAPVHHLLQTNTNPNVIGKNLPDASETEIRQAAFHAMESAIGKITEDSKNAMYFDARSLYCLKKLASFPFERVIAVFQPDPSSNGKICSAAVVRDLLEDLDHILFSLKVIPSMPLLESLFIFLLQDRVQEQGVDINKEIRNLLDRAEEALSVIRNFNKQVPLTAILRCAARDLTIVPKEIAGGEDWLVVYREYWKHRIEALCAAYIKELHLRALFNAIRCFLKGTDFTIMDCRLPETTLAGMPIKGVFPVKGLLSLSFILAFYSVVFMGDVNKVLRPILLDGDFFRKENRAEFTESYNNLAKLGDDIERFETSISPSGDYIKRYVRAMKETVALPVKRRKMQTVIEAASGEAAAILEQTRKASVSMINVLNGILEKNPQEKYDTLVNMFSLSRRGRFAAGIGETVKKLQTLLQLLDDIDAIEAGGTPLSLLPSYRDISKQIPDEKADAS
ncbi:MAG: DUF5312 domain-containing protein [Treponema sp.]|jgi:hypothetical protein|nr:DUF5312 domain-containing protein [Treponema sp.]